MSCQKRARAAAGAAKKNGVGTGGSLGGYLAGSTAQLSFFTLAGKKKKKSQSEKLPSQRQVLLANEFSPEELGQIGLQLRLGAAAAARRLRELKHGSGRDIGRGDPRPADWARSDRRQYRFLAGQVRRAQQEDGYLDTSDLKSEELVGLWQFAKFEADRAHRNIDHLLGGLGHLKGPTADYLAAGHKLEARFYTFLAGQLEVILPPEKLAVEDW